MREDLSQADTDADLARRIIAIADEMLGKGGEATAGLTALLREIMDHNPAAYDRFDARLMAGRLGLAPLHP